MGNIVKIFFKKVYVIFWYIFLFIFGAWLLIGIGYNYFCKSTIEEDKAILISVLKETYPNSDYSLAREPYDTNRRNLISKAVSIDIYKDKLHSNISEIRPTKGEWELVRTDWNYYIYVNEAYRIYIMTSNDSDYYQVTIVQNTWYETFSF